MSEWGPWTEHDGKGCPVPLGSWVEVNVYPARCVIIGGGFRIEFRVSTHNADWVGWKELVHYRIRKPRGLTILENLLADLPAPQPGKVDS